MIGIAFAGSLLSGTSEIELSVEDETTLASVGVTNPVISQLVCDGNTCRACASQEIDTGRTYTKGEGIGQVIVPITINYGMGCIDIPQKECSSWNTNQTECLIYTDFTPAELKTNRDESFKLRWEGIASAIRERQAKINEAKVDAGTITIKEK